MFKLRITGDLGFEFWMDIPGYEGLYQASTYGRVKSVKRFRKGKNNSVIYCPEKILSIKKNLRYDHITLNSGKHGASKTISLHKIIAHTFIPNFNNYPYINHRDENPKNNRIENLEYCTPKYNQSYGTCRQRQQQTYSQNEKEGKHKHKTTPIQGTNIDTGETVQFKSIADAARYLGNEKYAPNINAALKGKISQSHNHIWKYLGIVNEI